MFEKYLPKMKNTIIQLKEIEINKIEQPVRQIKTIQTMQNKKVINLQGKLILNESQSQQIQKDIQNNMIQILVQIRKEEQKNRKQPNQSQKILQNIWSQRFKTDGIKINKSQTYVASQLKHNDNRIWQFSLFQEGFSQETKNKQCWAFKINQKRGGMDLGLCLKNVLQENKFKYQDIDWFQIGHGLYVQGSTGCCYHHEIKEYNHVKRSFEFKKGDVIYMQYDPLEQKLRFKKNKGPEIFQMHIGCPPNDDAYHPCVAFQKQNDSVELSMIEEFL